MAGGPPATIAGRVLVDSTPTDLLVSKFGNAVLAMATQTRKMGAVMRTATNASPLSGDTISVATLLGRRDDELSVAVARMVAARLRHSGSDLPVIACVSLRRSETPEEDARRVANALAHLAAHHCSR